MDSLAGLQRAFAADLDQLRRQAGLSIAELAKRARHPTSTVQDLLNGKWVYAPPWGRVSDLVEACVAALPPRALDDVGEEARRLANPVWWRSQHADLQRHLSRKPVAGSQAGSEMNAVLRRRKTSKEVRLERLGDHPEPSTEQIHTHLVAAQSQTVRAQEQLAKVYERLDEARLQAAACVQAKARTSQIMVVLLVTIQQLTGQIADLASERDHYLAETIRRRAELDRANTRLAATRTARKRAEDQLRQATAARDRATALAEAAQNRITLLEHELRTAGEPAQSTTASTGQPEVQLTLPLTGADDVLVDVVQVLGRLERILEEEGDELDRLQRTFPEFHQSDRGGTQFTAAEPFTDDTLQLQSSLREFKGWDTLYYAKRLLQINSNDSTAAAAVEHAAGMLGHINGQASFLQYTHHHELADIIKIGQLVERRAGDLIYRYQDQGDAMFVILRGEVGIYNVKVTERFSTAARPAFVLRPGEIVSEFTLLLSRNRSSNLVALSDAAFLAYNYDDVTKRLTAAARTFEWFVIARVLEYTAQAADYLIGPSWTGPLADGRGWRTSLSMLVDHSQLITPAAGPLDLNLGHLLQDTDDRSGLYVLVAGELTLPGAAAANLQGAQCPVLWIDLPQLKLVTRPPASYNRIAEPIRVLRIAATGINQLERSQRLRLRDVLQHADPLG